MSVAAPARLKEPGRHTTRPVRSRRAGQGGARGAQTACRGCAAVPPRRDSPPGYGPRRPLERPARTPGTAGAGSPSAAALPPRSDRRLVGRSGRGLPRAPRGGRHQLAVGVHRQRGARRPRRARQPLTGRHRHRARLARALRYKWRRDSHSAGRTDLGSGPPGDQPAPGGRSRYRAGSPHAGRPCRAVTVRRLDRGAREVLRTVRCSPSPS